MRRVLGEDEQVVFVHIPKTAGTSFRLLLEARYKPKEINPHYFEFLLAGARRGDLARYRLIRGHFYLDMLRRLLVGEPVYITFLRDPIERAISTYAYMQSTPDPANHPFAVEKDLEAYVFHPQASEVLTDAQTRQLGAVLDCDGDVGLMEALGEEARRAQFGKHARADAALRVLESMPFFGLTERFDDSLALLSYTLGWPPFPRADAHNVTPRRPLQERIPAHILDRLHELNQQDLRLYHQAERLFEARMAQMHQDLLSRQD